MVPERRRKRSFMVRGRPQKAGTWMVLVGESPQSDQAHIGELVLAVISPCRVLSVPDDLRH